MPKRLYPLARNSSPAPDEHVMAHRPLRGAMSAGNEKLVVEHLIERYSVVAGWQRYYVGELEKVRDFLAHLEGTIKFYKEDWDSTEARPRMPSFRFRYMKMGEGAGSACDVLREAAEPLTCREISRRALKNLDIEVTRASLKVMEASVRHFLTNRKPENVRRIDGRPLRYEVIRSD